MFFIYNLAMNIIERGGRKIINLCLSSIVNLWVINLVKNCEKISVSIIYKEKLDKPPFQEKN